MLFIFEMNLAPFTKYIIVELGSFPGLESTPENNREQMWKIRRQNVVPPRPETQLLFAPVPAHSRARHAGVTSLQLIMVTELDFFATPKSATFDLVQGEGHGRGDDSSPGACPNPWLVLYCGANPKVEEVRGAVSTWWRAGVVARDWAKRGLPAFGIVVWDRLSCRSFMMCMHLGRRQRRASMLWGHRDRQVALPFEKLVFSLYFRQREAVLQRKKRSHGLGCDIVSPRTKTRIVAKQLTVSCAWSTNSRREPKCPMSTLCCRGAFGRRVKLAPTPLPRPFLIFLLCRLPFLQAIAATCDEQRVEWKKEYFGAW